MNLDIKNILRKFEERGGAKIIGLSPSSFYPMYLNRNTVY